MKEGELVVTESMKKHEKNQDWTTRTHSAYNKEGNVQTNNKLNTPGTIGNAHVKNGDQNIS